MAAGPQQKGGEETEYSSYSEEEHLFLALRCFCPPPPLPTFNLFGCFRREGGLG